MNLGRVVLGRVLCGASCLGASCPQPQCRVAAADCLLIIQDSHHKNIAI